MNPDQLTTAIPDLANVVKEMLEYSTDLIIICHPDNKGWVESCQLTPPIKTTLYCPLKFVYVMDINKVCIKDENEWTLAD